MKPEADISELVDALRADLPTEADSVRLRARLAALGIATGATLSGSAAGASALAAKGTASAMGGLFSQAAALSWGAKLGLAAAFTASAVAGSVSLLRSSGSVSSAKTQVTATASPPAARARAQQELGARSSFSGSTAEQEPRLDAFESGALAERSPASGQNGAAPSEPAAASNAAERIDAAASGSSRAGGAPRAAELHPASAPAMGALQTSSASSGSFPIASEQPLETTLREETRLIDLTFAALRAGNAARAAELISDHERRFPNGLLKRERERARVKLSEISRQKPRGE